MRNNILGISAGIMQITRVFAQKYPKPISPKPIPNILEAEELRAALQPFFLFSKLHSLSNSLLGM